MFSIGKKQMGCIVFGNGMNVRKYIEDAKAQGYLVLICDGYAELYKSTARGQQHDPRPSKHERGTSLQRRPAR